MSLIDLILLGMVIASNNLSFSFGLGALGADKHHLRIVLLFTLVEFTIPLIGLFFGSYLSPIINEYAEIIGSLILIGLGIYTIYSSFGNEEKKHEVLEKIESIKGLFLIALGLSLDNLLVGFSLGLNEVEPIKLASFIAFFSMTFTYLGLKTGKWIKSIYGKYVQVFAGLALVLIGIFML